MIKGMKIDILIMGKFMQWKNIIYRMFESGELEETYLKRKAAKDMAKKYWSKTLHVIWLFDTNPAIYQGLAYFLWFFDACVSDIHSSCYLEGAGPAKFGVSAR